MLNLEKTKSGEYTIKYNNKYLHSKYNPRIEGWNLIKRYKFLIKEPYVIVYGLGLGYHIEEILKINKHIKIYVFEGNKEIVNLCKNINGKLFNEDNVKIIVYKDLDFYKQLSKVITDVKGIIIHKPSLEAIKDKNIKLYTLINNYTISRESVDDSGLLINNYKDNLKVKYEKIKKLIEKFEGINKPCIITSAGPSLDNDLQLLKKNRNTFMIISVGTALNTLMENNIKPDIIVIIDGSEAVANQLRGFENENIPLCFLSTASRWAVKSYNGPKYMFFNAYDEDEIIIETGKTVAVAAINIGIKCDAKEIVLLGQDLAYLNGKSHTNTYQKIYGEEDKPIINEHTTLVQGINGEMLKTTKGYIYFKTQIENIIEKNKNRNFINCSKGALIKGAKHLNFSKYLNEYFKD